MVPIMYNKIFLTRKSNSRMTRLSCSNVLLIVTVIMNCSIAVCGYGKKSSMTSLFQIYNLGLPTKYLGNPNINPFKPSTEKVSLYLGIIL